MSEKDISFKIDGKHLIITIDNNEFETKFPCDIHQVLDCGESFVVILDVSLSKGVIQQPLYNQNVFGVSYEGKILWQIEALSSDTPRGNYLDWDPYTGMGLEGDKLKLCKYRGVDLLVDPKTGKILEKGFSK